ncbi:MAG: hypothetical protein R2715_06235 [Ilumatobacteraceae bacterium]
MTTTPARRLASLLEPVAGQVYFSPECHAAYVELGFDPSPGDFNGVAGPDGPAYFTSRGSVMGQVPGEVVAAAFAVFSPAAVVPSVTLGWSRTDATTICAARDRGAIAQLRRVLGDAPEGLDRVTDLLTRACDTLRPEGRPLYAGLRSLPLPDEPIGAMWRQADRLREYRGDSHTAAWISAGFDACEIGMLSELYWGLPLRSYARTRAWSAEEFDAAEARLVERGLVADGGFTETGRAAREGVEQATDAQMDVAMAAIGDDGLAELERLMGPWGAALRAERAYPASGPHDLARVSG